MTGGGPEAGAGLAKSMASINKHFAMLCSLQFERPDITSRNWKLVMYQCLEAVRQFYAEAAAILLDNVLNMETGGGISVAPIQEVINAG